MGLILLASASPRRHEILKQLNIAHKVLKPVADTAPHIDDEPQQPGETAIQYVKRTALEKALNTLETININAANTYSYILSADTTVCLNGNVLGKPQSDKDAYATLQMLSGNTHQVYTAIVVVRIKDQAIFTDMSDTQVSFKKLSNTEIESYISTGEPYGKAGAYAIQGQAAAFVSNVSGSYTGVVGLPAYETYELLRQAGAIS